MAAKNKRRPTSGYALQNALAAHIEASAKADDWAEKCLAFRQAGKTTQAKAAENKAKKWLRRAMVIEASAARGPGERPNGWRCISCRPTADREQTEQKRRSTGEAN